jgi:hypothetical protein
MDLARTRLSHVLTFSINCACRVGVSPEVRTVVPTPKARGNSFKSLSSFFFQNLSNGFAQRSEKSMNWAEKEKLIYIVKPLSTFLPTATSNRPTTSRLHMHPSSITYNDTMLLLIAIFSLLNINKSRLKTVSPLTPGISATYLLAF